MANKGARVGEERPKGRPKKGAAACPYAVPPGHVNDRPADRTCLGCGKAFPSRGPHHRICSVCRGRKPSLSRVQELGPTKVDGE